MAATSYSVQPPPNQIDRTIEQVPGKIWWRLYSIKMMGMVEMTVRTVIVKMSDGKLWVHSPGPISPDYKKELAQLGPVGYIVAANLFHNIWVSAWQTAYPEAKVYLVTQLETKLHIDYHKILDNSQVEPEWSKDFSHQVLINAKKTKEVIFFHESSKSLIVTDFVMNLTNSSMQFGFNGLSKAIASFSGAKNKVSLPPSYWPGFVDRFQTKQIVTDILNNWRPQSVIVGHGDVLQGTPEQVATQLSIGWASILK